MGPLSMWRSIADRISKAHRHLDALRVRRLGDRRLRRNAIPRHSWVPALTFNPAQPNHFWTGPKARPRTCPNRAATSFQSMTFQIAAT